MDDAIRFLGDAALPLSLQFLLIGIGLALVLLKSSGRWRRRLGWYGLLALFAAYWIMSLEGLSLALATAVTRDIRPVTTRAEARGADAVVLLSAGGSVYRAGRLDVVVPTEPNALRILEVARLYHLLDPRWVVVSGATPAPGRGPESDSAFDPLVKLGVPARCILFESRSMNTREHAVELATFLPAHGIRRFVLVTSPIHMRRAMASLSATGLDFVPSGSHEREAEITLPRMPWWPSAEGLGMSHRIVHEYVGLAYYGLRGWLSASPAATGERAPTNSRIGSQ